MAFAQQHESLIVEPAEGAASTNQGETKAPLLLFHNPQQDSDSVLARATHHRIARQTVLYREGERVDHLFVVETGSFKRVRQSRDGKELIVSLAGPGDLFGGFVEAVEAKCLVQALEPSTCLSIPVGEIQNAIANDPGLGARLLRYVDGKHDEAEAAAARIAFDTVPQRLAHLIVSHADPDSGELRFPLTQSEIASLIGSSRETVCSILNRFRREGAVALSRGRIRIVARERLTSA